MPHFFIYAKNKKKEQCEKIAKNKSDINIIDSISKHIKENRNMFKMVSNLNNVDYKILLKDKIDYGVNKELNKVFDRNNRNYGYNIRIDDRDKRNNNINEICKQVMSDLLLIEPDIDKMICSITRFLYENPTERKKKLFWTLFGEQLYNNISNNIKDLPKYVCMKCGKRTDEKLINKKCSNCRQEEIKSTNGMKEITCIDCGKKIMIPYRSRTNRCEECRLTHRKIQIKENVREFRKQSKM